MPGIQLKTVKTKNTTGLRLSVEYRHSSTVNPYLSSNLINYSETSEISYVSTTI